MKSLACCMVVSAALLAGCTKQHPVGSGWLQVEEQTACEALQPSSCVGAFGFTVRSDGSFVIGPATDGSVDTGAVPVSDRTTIAADVSALDVDAAPQCEASPVVPGVADRVDVTLADGTVFRVFDLGTTPNQTCYRGGREVAIRLHDDVAALMAKLYVPPFPR